MLGSVTEKVLRKAPCPVLMVSGQQSAPAAATLKSILCPVVRSADCPVLTIRTAPA